MVDDSLAARARRFDAGHHLATLVVERLDALTVAVGKAADAITPPGGSPTPILREYARLLRDAADLIDPPSTGPQDAPPAA